MNFIEELEWRGMLHDSTPGMGEHLSTGKRIGYIGFDPTAKSLTIGNYVQLMILTLFQRAGHQPIVLMGGATGRIGDPSGKSSERELMTYEALDTNVHKLESQFRHLLDFDNEGNPALMVNNLDFYKDMPVLDFLRNVGKHLTINYMLSKDSVKARLDSGMSFTEFSYQLLQGYDFLCLLREHDCTIQMGGSDQWGNITSGTEFIRRNDAGKAYAVTTPLLTKADGSKFGKSEAGNIWLDPDMTSPYQFYQFWINVDDQDLSRFLRFFSLKSHDEIERLEAQAQDDPRTVKQVLAEELTTRVHSKSAAESASAVSQILFNPRADAEAVRHLREDTLEMLNREIPVFHMSKAAFNNEINILDLLSEHTEICKSKGDARRSVLANAVSVNKQKVSDLNAVVAASELLHSHYLLIENGKKNKFLIQVMD